MVASPNFGERRPSLVVLHYTTNDGVADALRTLTRPETEVSAHYLIGRDGSLRQLVDERFRAWHAGESAWGTIHDVNSVSLGIELDNNGSEPFDEPEIATLLALLSDLRDRYRLTPDAFWGHSDVAPRRKLDPGKFFPWRRLAQQGFGLWCDPPFAPVAAGFDPVLGLAALGYDVSDPIAAASAFRLHFEGEARAGAFSTEDTERLACLLRQARGLQPLP